MKALLTEKDLENQVILKKKSIFCFFNFFKFKDNVFILILNKPSNSFSFDFIRKINEKLDEVEKSEGQACLMTVSTDPKIYSTGLELRYF